MTETDTFRSGQCPAVSDLSGPLLVALLSGDERGVEEAFGAAGGRGADLAVVARDLIEPALDEVGRMWRAGELSVAEEHLATALVFRAFSRQAASVACPPLGAPRLVLTCLAGEFHELGVRIVSEVARSSGWQAEALGANTPREAAIRYIALRRPDAVGLSLALAAHVAECSVAVEEIRKAAPGAKILVGGFAFRHDRALGDLTGADVCFGDAVCLKEWLLANRPCRGEAETPRADACRTRVAEALRKKTGGGR
ncbi:MAG TPA: cobalamin B12-binding domain-containing protein [Thermoanaerobaculia bacterium]|nr:cobalamin B12-binding domain-containing protein [Thermoanaerobaculia bacterium]HQR68918.1 cobalamin B12-binding domain-containing protein [Thermoanaerobaculia bacterium]